MPRRRFLISRTFLSHTAVDVRISGGVVVPSVIDGPGGKAWPAVIAIGWRGFCHHLVISCLWACWYRWYVA